MAGAIPYCGVAPLPDEIWSRWNADPLMLGILAIIALLYAAGSVGEARVGAGRRSERLAFVAGLALTGLVLASPLCALSVALSAARVAQHLLLALVAAPLIALGHPLRTINSLVLDPERLEEDPPIERGAGRLLACAGFAIALWIWHSRAPYDATFASTPIYWAMHLSVLLTAIALWDQLLAPADDDALSRLPVGLFAALQAALLGALLALAPQPVFTAHLLTTSAWGLTPLQDQQLGGTILLIAGAVVFLAVSALGLYRSLLLRSEQRAMDFSGAAWH